MKKLSAQTGFIHIFLILGLILAIGAATYAIQHPGFLALAAPGGIPGKPTPKPTPSVFHATPLNDLGTGLYLNQFQGGLFENGTNAVPSDHDITGASASANIKPLDISGNSLSTGKVVLLSISMSNGSLEWCGTSGNCTSSTDNNSFMAKAAASTAVNHNNLAIVNGAQGSQDLQYWENTTIIGKNLTVNDYDMVRDQRLAPLGLTEKQVQAVWLKNVNAGPTASLKDGSSADAYIIMTKLGNVIRTLKSRYPNLQEVFLSSRIYAGYATSTLNPEPYAYESGFAVKWFIQDQIDQMRNGGIVVDSKVGDLNYATGIAPWLSWGPYLWADDNNPRSDGLTWVKSTDYASDYTHPNTNGINKVATQLMNFFLNSSQTKCWFTAAGCP